ncbi:hypothetical protein CC86DRAFT_470799 [Ophiobolus disseminans]|uniref:Uncharacterized protein n=1 Tax=Ophiobolus disseminans TaxID=1469910 RepID=A0A6A6ZJT1_9PLEO|nr:hypothetical protein CC86DRAFT_470799 [Ophiobolus disseminans]
MEGKGKFGQEINTGDETGCIRGFEATGTENGCEMALQIAASMRKDTKRAPTLTKEQDLVRGKKIKGPFGWYFTAAEGREKTGHLKWIIVGAIVAFMTMGFLLAVGGIQVSIAITFPFASRYD